jgi:hypothetical protein
MGTGIFQGVNLPGRHVKHLSSHCTEVECECSYRPTFDPTLRLHGLTGKTLSLIFGFVNKAFILGKVNPVSFTISLVKKTKVKLPSCML